MIRDTPRTNPAAIVRRLADDQPIRINRVADVIAAIGNPVRDAAASYEMGAAAGRRLAEGIRRLSWRERERLQRELEAERDRMRLDAIIADIYRVNAGNRRRQARRHHHR